MRELLVVLAIVLIAAILRLYNLDQLPPGLHYDEAFKGVMARKLIVGPDCPIFFTENLTEEPMMEYATALSFQLFGDTAWHIRLVSAIAGIITVAALYFLARQLFQQRWVAWLATFVLAVLYWHLNFSRLGMEPILTPMTLTLAFVFLWRGIFCYGPQTNADEKEFRVRPRLSVATLAPHPFGSAGVRVLFSSPNKARWGSLALGGFFLASTQYTYKAALFVPFLVVAFFGVEIVVERGFLRQNWRKLIFCALVAVLFFAPLGLYFVAHPDQFLERPTTVTVVSSGTNTIFDNALKVAGMFFLRGDDNPRSNLPGRPVLDPFLAIGFIAGLIVCIVRIRRRESRLLLLWLGVMALPSVLTDFAPHFGRDIGAIPVIPLIVANGFGAIVEQIRPRKLLFYCSTVLLFTGLAFSTYSTVNDYFNGWGKRTGLFDSFDVGILSLGQKLHDRPANEALYVSPIDSEYYTMNYGLAGRDVRSFDGRKVLVAPPSGVIANYGIITRDDKQSLNRLSKIFPQGRVVDLISDYIVMPYASIYRTDGAANIAPQKSVNAQLGDAIKLIGYDVTRDNSTIVYTIYWRSIAETKDDYTVFVHLTGAMNPATQSPVWAQDDARPGRSSYPTFRWRMGETIIDEYRLTIPTDAPQGEYQIEVGMYNLETGARVRMIDATGAPMENDRVIFERSTLP